MDSLEAGHRGACLTSCSLQGLREVAAGGKQQRQGEAKTNSCPTPASLEFLPGSLRHVGEGGDRILRSANRWATRT